MIGLDFRSTTEDLNTDILSLDGSNFIDFDKARFRYG